MSGPRFWDHVSLSYHLIVGLWGMTSPRAWLGFVPKLGHGTQAQTSAGHSPALSAPSLQPWSCCRHWHCSLCSAPAPGWCWLQLPWLPVNTWMGNKSHWNYGSQCQVSARLGSVRFISRAIPAGAEPFCSLRGTKGDGTHPVLLPSVPLHCPTAAAFSSKAHSCPGVLSDTLMNTQQRGSQITQNCLLLIYGAAHYHQPSEQNNTWAENRALCTAPEAVPAIPSGI